MKEVAKEKKRDKINTKAKLSKKRKVNQKLRKTSSQYLSFYAD